jgi:hypothetical protein
MKIFHKKARSIERKAASVFVAFRQLRLVKNGLLASSRGYSVELVRITVVANKGQVMHYAAAKD